MALNRYKEINLTKDKKRLVLINLLALILLFLGFWFFSYLGALIKGLPDRVSATFGLETILLYLVAFVLLLFIHEGIHGYFFKRFAPGRPVKYRFHGYALSASSPETKYSKGKFIWIGLAPFVLITISLSLAFLSSGISFLAYVFLASFHTSGCVGDFYFTYLLLKEPADILVEDTGDGMIFYKEEVSTRSI